MKRLPLFLPAFIILFFCLISGAQAQKQYATTAEEYSYLTKGYKMQVEGGLDMKQGYELEDIMTERRHDYVVEIKALFRFNEKRPCAHLLQVAKGKEISYLCLPTFNAGVEMWEDFNEAMGLSPKVATEKTAAITYALSRLAAFNAAKY
jgi:hypothetical protein